MICSPSYTGKDIFCPGDSLCLCVNSRASKLKLNLKKKKKKRERGIELVYIQASLVKCWFANRKTCCTAEWNTLNRDFFSLSIM